MRALPTCLVLALLPSLGALSGCTGVHDGSWLIFYSMTENSHEPDYEYIGVEFRMLANLYRTNEQHFFEMSGQVLPGTVEGDHFDVGTSRGMDASSDDCGTYEMLTTTSFVGDFTSDGGLTGEIEVRETLNIADCDPIPDNTETMTLKYAADGVHLDSRADDHAPDSANWGYIPGSVY